MNQDARAAFFAEEKRHCAELVRLIARYPQYRAHFAYALLGTAVATCDTFGLDVESWLAELRKREPRPSVLVPPKSRQS